MGSINCGVNSTSKIHGGAKLLLRCDGLRRATLSVNLLVYEGCDGLRRATFRVNLPVYEDIKAAQREELSKAVGFAFSDESLSLVAEQRG